jgi:hypothetical protein
VDGLGESAAARRAQYEGSVSCGISGHDHPSAEYVASLAMRDGFPLSRLNWAARGSECARSSPSGDSTDEFQAEINEGLRMRR